MICDISVRLKQSSISEIGARIFMYIFIAVWGWVGIFALDNFDNQVFRLVRHHPASVLS